jgi:uncharacterized protein YndB with AHSA1/START domain
VSDASLTDGNEIPPLVLEFEVGAVPEHAFETWVSRAHLWWPMGHTVSGGPVAVVFEPHHGGRIYERTVDGGELPWGEVIDWEPPRRLRFLWHLFFDRQEATTVEVTFEPSEGGTIVRLVQTGWGAFGDDGAPRRERTILGWAAVTDEYRRWIGNPAHE